MSRAQFHLRLAEAVSPDTPVQLRITPADSEFEIAIAGFDYLGQFSLICGLISAFALDIRSADIDVLPAKSQLPKVVDLFRVAPLDGETFDEIQQREFAGELLNLTRLLAGRSTQDARSRLYRFLTERIERLHQGLGGLRSPLSVTFDNRQEPNRTIMNVEADDTFAFLYAVSNALSLRGIDIHSVQIRSTDKRSHDVFVISDRFGQKIKEGAAQERLTLAVRMIEQFTAVVTEAPDPAKAMHHFDQFLDKLVEIADSPLYDRALSVLSSDDGMRRLARLLGSSDDLWENFLRIRFAKLLPFIERETMPAQREEIQRELHELLDRTPADNRRAVLNEFKDRQLFLIDIHHLLRVDDTAFGFSQSLTDLAEAVLDEAARVSLGSESARHGKFAIFGLGKFGGREMGYASDLELLFVHDGNSEFFEAVAHRIVGLIEARNKAVFHIDLRLRPHGDAGSWSTSLDEFSKYYRVGGDALPFERQALIKLRWFAGDAELGRRVAAHRDSFTYGEQPWDWKDALTLRERQINELVQPGKINVKYSAGGLIDIEYATQYLQLLNGSEYREIRLPSTLDALGCLRQLQIVRENDYHLLCPAYLFLRKLIDALRIVRGDSGDLVLPDRDSTEEYKSLARRMGYHQGDRATDAGQLAADIGQTMKDVHSYFVMRFKAAGI